MQARHFKIVLWVSALIVIWQLGRSDYVLDSMFVFAATGAVPGTGIVLNPNQVFWALAATLVVALLLIFATNLRRGLLRIIRREHLQQDKSLADRAEILAAAVVTDDLAADAIADAAPALAEVQPAPAKAKNSPVVVVIKPAPHPSKLAMAVRVWAGATRLRVQHLLERLAAHYPGMVAASRRLRRRVVVVLARIFTAAKNIIVKAATELYYLGRIAAGVLAGWSVLASRFLRRNFIRAGVFVGRTSLRLWRWAEPHLRIFDYWLGVQYHTYLDAAKQNETVKSARHLKKEVVRVVGNIRAQARAMLSRAVEK